MSTATAQRRSRTGRLSMLDVAGWLVVGSFAIWQVIPALAILFIGSSYYALPSADRPEHHLHEAFRAGGPVGLLLGFLGTMLMLVMLLYSVRKWVGLLGALDYLGTPAWWLRFHMICGVMGPVFIVLHGGFAMPSGLVAIGFWCMLLVSVSGLFGRYLFGHFPQAAAGRRLDLQYARERLNELTAQLVAETRTARADQIGQAVQLVRDLHHEPRTLLGLMMLDVDVRARADVVAILLARSGLPEETRADATRTLVAQLHMQRAIAGWEVARRFFRYWHLFHQPLALAMYLIMALHVFNAVTFGGVLTTLLGGDG